MLIVYEVNLDIDTGIADEFDAWLREHVAEMVALPGFESARIWNVDGDGARARRCVHYVVTDRGALERYLEVDAPRMRAAGIERFGERLSASRRVLAPPR